MTYTTLGVSLHVLLYVSLHVTLYLLPGRLRLRGLACCGGRERQEKNTE